MQRKSGFYLMKRLILESKPLLPVMLITIMLGVLGFLASIGIASFATIALGAMVATDLGFSFNLAVGLMGVLAVSRGFLRYGEQLSGHYVAFKLLAILRDAAFGKLRELAPAKLQGKDRGDLIALITADIEMLEVFYAHTIAPITIAVLTNSLIALILGAISPIFGFLGLVSFLLVGFAIPYFSSAVVAKNGLVYRQVFAFTNHYVLDSLRGLREILLFNQGAKRLRQLDQESIKLNASVEKLKAHEGLITGLTSLVVTLTLLLFVGIGFYFYATGVLDLTLVLLAIVIIASAFGPVVALSNLSNTLSQTFACAQRLFDLFDEEAQVKDVVGELAPAMTEIVFKNVSFAYPNQSKTVLEAVNLQIKKGDKLAIVGKSGIGKSTLIKLLMRYFDVNSGQILLDGQQLNTVATASLRKQQTLVEQETYLFNDSILNNLRLGQQQASLDEVKNACQKAAIHEFIEGLPAGYATNIGELGSRLSSGERQRLGLARAFLHNGEVLILDEPTSNLDALNEGAVLKSLSAYNQAKTLIMISHRQSSTAICEQVYRIEAKKLVLQAD